MFDLRHIQTKIFLYGHEYIFCHYTFFFTSPVTTPQWASIADVGTVALMGTGNETIICRKYPQRFFNVLSVFDYMMSSDNAVTISYVLVEKSMGVAGGEESMVDQVLRAVGKVLGERRHSCEYYLL